MFDIGWPELMLIGVVALVVIGPKELPNAIYGIGKWVRKARVVAREFQGHFDEMMREAELDDLRKQAMAARHLDFKDIVEKHVDPKGEIRDATTLPPMNEIGEAKAAAEPTADVASVSNAEPVVEPANEPATKPADVAEDVKSIEKGA